MADHVLALVKDGDGWFDGRCSCGQGLVAPDAEDIADWYGDHRADVALLALFDENQQFKARLSAVREIAVEPVNSSETPELRLAMIVRLIDSGQDAVTTERVDPT